MYGSVMNKKFTIVELLVVIAILGVLMSILLPSLRNAREKAKDALCLSNQKQCGALLFQSAAKNNGKVIARAGRGLESFWSSRLKEDGYDTNESYEVYRCPSYVDYDVSFKPFQYTFGINGQGHVGENNTKSLLQHEEDVFWTNGNGSTGQGKLRVITLQGADTPSEFVLLADSYDSITKKQVHTLYSSRVHLRHNRKVNTLFADGHAQAVSHSRIVSFGFNNAHY